MQDEIDNLREQLRRERPASRQLGWPQSLRHRAAHHALRRHAGGESWRAIGASLGVCRTTVRSWVRALGEPGGTSELVPVVVTPAPRSAPTAEGLVLVSPRGFRVEGLDIDAAIAALERLG